MADQGAHGIAWTETTWNPIRGCSRVSEGCRHCYAEAIAHRFSGPGQPYEGLTTADGKWNGVVRVVEDHMNDPLTWRRPRLVFVNSMSDLFHESLPDTAIDCVFHVMEHAPQHQFQVLTKRVHRMRPYHQRKGVVLPNVWMGVSVEDTGSWNERVSSLRDTPAAIRWVSVEPQLANICPRESDLVGIDWLVIGGESGPDARPFDTRWARQWIELGRATGTAIFIKQLGSHAAYALGMKSRKGGDMDEWPQDLRVREYPVIKEPHHA